MVSSGFYCRKCKIGLIDGRARFVQVFVISVFLHGSNDQLP